eukprot:1980867-Pleurochrysis_carterae.AAC.2
MRRRSTASHLLGRTKVDTTGNARALLASAVPPPFRAAPRAVSTTEAGSARPTSAPGAGEM